MTNKERKFSRNMRGISMNDEIGKINITKPLWRHLGCPQYIKFTYKNHDWIKLTKGSPDCPSSGHVVQQGTGLAINDVELVRCIYKEYKIIRYDKTVMSPFYTALYREESGEKVVYVKLNNF